MSNIIGIRREDKNIWERRVPLTPDDVRSLVQQDFQVQIQPSEIRIFKDEEYESAGAVVIEDLLACGIVFGVKEFPIKVFVPGQAYMFFSHTIKGQDYNMAMLKEIMEKGCTLFDYEKVTDDQNRRLIFFGNYAGLAGMLESFYTLGKRLEWEGVETQFLDMKRPLHYQSLEEARTALMAVGKRIEEEGLPEELGPVVVGFTGYGNVSKGAQEILELLPHEEIAPGELASFIEKGEYSRHKVYKVVFYEKDMVVHVDGEFDLQDYFDHPEKYRGVFDQYLEHLTVLVNCIFWTPDYPILVSKQWLKDNWTPSAKLKVIGDITCDIEGSAECTMKSTEPGDPVFTYLPEADEIVNGWEGNGPVVMAVDTLPSELPREASVYFGQKLMPFVPTIAKADLTVDHWALKIPPEIMRSLIVHKGRLTPDFEYIQGYL